MSVFKYEVIDESNGHILRPKALEVLLLSRVVMSLLKQNKEALRLKEDNANPIAFDYFKAAKSTLNNIKYLVKDKKSQILMNAAVRKISAAMDTAKAKIESDDGRLMVMSDFDEIWLFFKEVGVECVDSLTILEDKPSKPEDNEDDKAEHLTKIQISYDDNNWIYALHAYTKKPLKTTLFINDVKSPMLCQNSMLINALFNMMAIMAQKELIDSNFIEQFKQEPETVKKAKATASILGGKYENYLLFVASIASHIPYLGRTNEMQKNSINLIVDDKLRATEQQRREVAKIFLSKPNYH